MGRNTPILFRVIELPCTEDIGFSSLNLIKIILHHHTNPSHVIPQSNHHNLKKSSESTPHGLLVPVLHKSGTQDEHRHDHGRSRDTESPDPSELIVYVHHEGDAQKGSHVYGEEEPVEEGVLLLGLVSIRFIELVRPERGDAGLDSSGAEGDEG